MDSLSYGDGELPCVVYSGYRFIFSLSHALFSSLAMISTAHDMHLDLCKINKNSSHPMRSPTDKQCGSDRNQDGIFFKVRPPHVKVDIRISDEIQSFPDG